MAATLYGLSPADVAADPSGNIVAGQPALIYTALTGGTQYTQTYGVNSDGSQGASNGGLVSTDTQGRLGFYADTTQDLWLDWGGGTRWRVGPANYTNYVTSQVGDLSTTLSASVSEASSAASAASTAVAAIAPDDSARAVGKGEIAVNAMDYGAVRDGSTSDSAAINALLAQLGAGGHVLLTGGPLGGSFLIDAPILIQASNQRVTVDASATLLVPSGYAGNVIQIGNTSASVQGVIVEGGGRIAEVGKSGGSATAPGTWTGVQFHASTGFGVTGAHVTGLRMDWPGTGVSWSASGTGWVNGCHVDHVKIYYANIFFDIATTSTNFSNNTIGPVLGQCGQYTTYGIRGINGDNWTFSNVALWDIQLNAAAVSSQILSGAININIVGGFLTLQNFSNAAAENAVNIIDAYTVRPWIRPELIRPGDCVARNIANKPTLSQNANDWPYWSFADAVTSSVSFIWQLPTGYTKAELDLQVLDVSGLSGSAVFQATFMAEPTGANSNSANLTVANPAANARTSAAITKTPLTAGAMYRIYITRLGADAADTLAGAVGLLGVYVKPIK